MVTTQPFVSQLCRFLFVLTQLFVALTELNPSSDKSVIFLYETVLLMPKFVLPSLYFLRKKVTAV